MEAFSSSKFSKLDYLVDIISFCASEEWCVNESERLSSMHPKLNYEGFLCVKALKLITHALGRFPSSDKTSSLDFSLLLAPLEKLIRKYSKKDGCVKTCNKHLAFLLLKLLSRLLGTFPSARSNISVKLLQDLGHQINNISGDSVHRKILRLAIKFSKLLTES